LKWLDSWESKILTGEITEKLFLTKSTAEGLRVTLNSTLAMTNYLVEKFEFKYILTGKINQDALEVFITFNSNNFNLIYKNHMHITYFSLNYRDFLEKFNTNFSTSIQITFNICSHKTTKIR